MGDLEVVQNYVFNRLGKCIDYHENCYLLSEGNLQALFEVHIWDQRGQKVGNRVEETWVNELEDTDFNIERGVVFAFSYVAFFVGSPNQKQADDVVHKRDQDWGQSNDKAMDDCFFVINLPQTQGEFDQCSHEHNQESPCEGSEFIEDDSFMWVLKIFPDDVIGLGCSHNWNVLAFNFESALIKPPVAEQKFGLFEQVVIF